MDVMLHFPFYHIRLCCCREPAVCFLVNVCSEVVLVLNKHQRQSIVEVDVRSLLCIHWYLHFKLKFFPPQYILLFISKCQRNEALALVSGYRRQLISHLENFEAIHLVLELLIFKKLNLVVIEGVEVFIIILELFTSQFLGIWCTSSLRCGRYDETI